MSNRNDVSLKRILTLAWRGWTKACPNCGGRGLFYHWFTLRNRCPHCGTTFEREEGYWTGAMGANIIVTELSFVVLMILVFIFTWPDPPIVPLIVGAVVYNIFFPMFFYPFSKTIWMGFDWAFNPSDDAYVDQE